MKDLQPFKMIQPDVTHMFVEDNYPWESHVSDWNRADSVPEAIGILHGMADVKGDSVAVAKALLFTKLATHPQKKIATTAQKLLAGMMHQGGLYFDSTFFIEAHLAILDFLQTRHEALLAAPFPHKIVNYLLMLQGTWELPRGYVLADDSKQCPHKHAPHGRDCVPLHRALQPHTEKIVRAFLTWGLGAYLETPHGWKIDEVRKIVETYLEQNGHNSYRSLSWFRSNSFRVNEKTCFFDDEIQPVANAAGFYFLLCLDHQHKFSFAK